MTTSATSALERENWTVRLGAPPVGPETVVLVPPHCSLQDGLARAKELLQTKRVVRLVAGGATDPVNRPAVPVSAEARTFLLTELDGYRYLDRSDAIAALMPSVERWLREVMDVFPEHDAAEVFLTAAMPFFYPAIEDWLFAEVVLETHGDDEIECLDPEYPAFRLLRRMRGEVIDVRSGGWPFASRWLLYLFGTLAKRGIAFVRETPARRALRKLRREPRRQRPSVWIALSGASLTVSRPVLELVSQLALAPHETVGTILQSTEWANRNALRSRDAFPALRHERLSKHLSSVEQGTAVETAGELFTVFARTVVASARAARKIAAHPPRIGVSNRVHSFEAIPSDVARLCTVSLLRAIEAARASAGLVERIDVADQPILVAQAQWPSDVVLMRTLERAGATTIEIDHGGLGENAMNLSCFRTQSRVRAMWTQAEARALAPYAPHQTVVGGYVARSLPTGSPSRRSRPSKPLRVLVASSYLATPDGNDWYRWRPYQARILAEGLEVLELLPSVELRWRTHPRDNPTLVKEYLARFPPYVLSQCSLEEDLSWCDVLVTSLSSVIVEALFYELPIFVHEIPLQGDIVRKVISDRRRFGATGPLVDRVAPLLDAASFDRLGPERELRMRLFGERGVPRSPRELLRECTAPRQATAQLGT